MFDQIEYRNLNARQKENYNFHQVAAQLAHYGFNSLRLTDDWQGADLIAVHIDGETVLKVQLKGRLTIDRKYEHRNIHIAFFDGPNLYVYDHDKLLQHVNDMGRISNDSTLWRDQGFRSWPSPPAWARAYLQNFRIDACHSRSPPSR